MKHIGINLAVIVLIAGAAAATIIGSAHDFSGETWTDEICLPCHTPHNADHTTIQTVPLWNHTTTTAVHVPYSDINGTLDATVGAPSNQSKACLSCHDGTVALDSFGGATGGVFISGGANFGTDLSNDHPISFTYDTALSTADGELYDPVTATTVLGGTIADDLLFGSGNNQMECASCHDVHNTISAGNDSLLLIDNTGSALCMTCHNK